MCDPVNFATDKDERLAQLERMRDMMESDAKLLMQAMDHMKADGCTDAETVQDVLQCGFYITLLHYYLGENGRLAEPFRNLITNLREQARAA